MPLLSAGWRILCLSGRITSELIKILGDWHSDAVLLYLTVPLSVQLESINVIAKVILSSH